MKNIAKIKIAALPLLTATSVLGGAEYPNTWPSDYSQSKSIYETREIESSEEFRFDMPLSSHALIPEAFIREDSGGRMEAYQKARNGPVVASTRRNLRKIEPVRPRCLSFWNDISHPAF